VLLSNQFHDILPGSSIRMANEEAIAELEGLEKDLERMRDAALRQLSTELDTSGNGEACVVANSLSWDREEVLLLDTATATTAWDAAGNRLASQPIASDGKRRLAIRARCAGMACETLYLGQDTAAEAPSPFSVHDTKLETPFYRVRFDKAGKITRLYDKEADRELVQKGRRLNDFYTAEDVPVVTDAWDIDLYYRDKIVYEDRCVAREVIADGPLLHTIRSRYHIGRHSMLVQDMTFYAHSRRIDFVTEVLWEETHVLLKVGFPVDVHADQWRNEIQFGHLTRALHGNTSFDAAKFEVCAHKWVDISEGDYGVALLNDCKYGHDGLDKMISLTLLKSAWAPDEKADKGRHVFTYALLPHVGGFSTETVVREAYALNVPVIARPAVGGGSSRCVRLCNTSNPNVIVEAVKKAEDGDAVILRLYEAGHTRARTTLAFDLPVAQAWECNALEREKGRLRLAKNGTLNLELRPFEIKTVKILLAR
jgi:alpha-mannosidase